MTTLERRYHKIDDFETRTDGDKFRFVGHVAKFNTWSQDLGGFREKIAPGAFRRTVKNADIRVLFNHDPNFVLGRNRSGTAAVEEDSIGLFVDVLAPDTSWARDLHESVKRKDIDQGSFGFRTVKDEWSESHRDRTLIEASLFDASIVTFPAYEDTNLSARSAFFVQGLTQSLRSGAEIEEKDRDELRRLLEKPDGPVEDHPEGNRDDVTRPEATDFTLEIRRLRAA